MTRKTRPVSWIKAALKEFDSFAGGAKSVCLAALTIAADGGKARYREADARHGFGRLRDCAVAFQGDAFRVVYSVQLAADIWVVHAFQKKSTRGIKTPKREIEVTKDRLKKLTEMFR